MERKVVIIPPNSEEIFERILSVDENNKPEGHLAGIREFLKQEGLEYKGYEKDAFYTIAMYLISIGYIVLQGEPTDTSLIYLPERISFKQYNWYHQNKKIFKRIKLSIIDKVEKRITSYDKSNLYEEKPFNKLKELIESKEIVEYEKEQVK